MRAFLPVIIAALASSLQAQPADLVLRNGKIVTMNPGTPTAQAIAVRAGKITALGADRAAAQWIGPNTKVIDLHGMLAIPGFIEGHGHFTGVGEFRMGLDLREARTWDEIVAQVGRAVKQAKPGEWIVGRGWHQSKWTTPPTPNVEGFPLHDSLDKVSPNNPVILTHASGHAAFVNGKALELAGVNGQTPNPSGGEILKDAKGTPTGLLRERAQGVISKARADYEAKRTAADRLAETDKAIRLAIDESLSKGITTFEDAGSPLATVDILKKMADAHELRMRIWMMLRAPNAQLAANLDRYNASSARATISLPCAPSNAPSMARSARAAPGFSHPTPTNPIAAGSTPTIPPTYARPPNSPSSTASSSASTPSAIAPTAKSSTSTKTPSKPIPTRRICAGASSTRSTSTPPTFRASDNSASSPPCRASIAPPTLPTSCSASAPKRAEEGAYVWQKLMKSGAIVGNGTDAPVEDVSPLASFYASVSRKLKDGTVFYPDQRMSREEALKSYTLNNAYAAFEEKLKGSLEPGKLADITVLSKDIMTIPEDEILATDVVYTIVGGKVAFDHTARPR